MDPQLSLLMANQAQVKLGDLVLDPFVGSGSLLVAAAYFGGYVVGSDIDYLMLHGKSRPSRIKQKVGMAFKNVDVVVFHICSLVTKFGELVTLNERQGGCVSLLVCTSMCTLHVLYAINSVFLYRKVCL
uniref:Ribosomal RNA large subunit methyltransferase K/L-like methyltransferase domain-containing protein n=2 Tax=Photinus pyralis TaxID=7054 RepID=A0A1Y1KSD1_PHOPY